VSTLARPALVAAVLLACAAALQPALRSEAWLPQRELLLPALLLLGALALVARALAAPAERRAAGWILAAGAVVGVLAAGFDGVRGIHGTLTLGVGQQRNHFDETGPGGRSLGLRPLGFAVGVERLAASGGGVVLALTGRGSVVLLPGGSVTAGGFRLAQPRIAMTGGVARLRLAASDGTRTEVTDVGPGQPGQAFGTSVELAQYFPDFALDAHQQPFTRSLEPRNPAALLTVTRAGQAWRAFVLQSMPGLHRVEPLGLSFSLLEVEPEQAVELAVHREPAAPFVLAAAVLLGVGTVLAAGRSRRPAASSGAFPDAMLLAAVGLAAALLLVDRGRVLGWSFGLAGSSGRTELAGVGLPLGVALLAALAATVLLVAARVSGEPGGVGLGRAASWLALLAGAVGLVLAFVRAAVLPDPLSLSLAAPLVAVALPLAVVAAVLPLPPASATLPDEEGWLLPGVVALSALATAAIGLAGLAGDGTYATPAAAAALAATLAGLAALQPAGSRWVQLPFWTALLALLARNY